MQQHIQISIAVTQQEVQEILIAQLSGIGYDAFEEEAHVLKAFIEQRFFDEASLRTILKGHSLSFESTILPVTNWNQEWEKNFQPVIIDDFCGIRADFHEPLPSVQYEIIITPKMSFGTGHHATSFMMVQLLRTIIVQDKYVFDFGTGTGILSILADKLGAKEVIAIDNDEWSMINAAENLAANKCEHVVLINSGNIPASKSFDIILANINKQVIVETLTQMRAQLTEHGFILLSGLLESDQNDVHKLAIANDLILKQQISRSGWIALKYQLQ